MQTVVGKGSKRAMALAPVALALGFALGAGLHGGKLTALAGLEAYVGPIGQLWTNALQVAVIPLVASLLVSGIGGMPSGRAFGRWGWTSLAVFAGLLIFAACYTFGIGGAYLAANGPGHFEASHLPEAPKVSVAGSFGDWVGGLIPKNLFDAASKGEMLPIVLMAILFALAVRTLPDDRRIPLLQVVEALRDAVMTYVRWVLLMIPLGAFALAFSFAAKSGWDVAGATLQFLFFSVSLMLGLTVLLYLLVSLLGRVSAIAFARAAAPAQLVAIGSRSSLAALPATVDGASQGLQLPDPASSVTLPLAVSVFKLNRLVSSPAKLLFLSAMFAVSLSAGDLVGFVVTVMLISISTPGVPSLGTNATFGAYVAAGIPPAAVAMFEAIEPLIDVVKTLLNVTGNLAAAVIVSRFCRTQVRIAVVAEPSGVQA